MIDRALLIVEAASAGAGKHTLDLAAGFCARGTAVDLVYGTARCEPAFLDRLPLLGLRNILGIETSRSPAIADLAAIRQVRRFAAANGPYDIVHGHAGKGGAYARLLPRTGARRFYTPHAFITQSPELGRTARNSYATIERLLARRTEGLILVSEPEATHARSLRLRPKMSTTIPNGIAFPQLPTRAEARRSLDLPTDGFIVGCVGRLSAQKGVDLLLDVTPRLLARCPDARLAIVGEGEAGPALRAQAKHLGIDDHVTWLGQRDGQRSMPAFDVLAMPSRYEGFPYVLLESLWANVPVLATEECNAHPVLGDGAAGRIVPRTVEAFGDELVALSLDREELHRMGSRGRELVRPFTLDAMVERTIEFMSGARTDNAVRSGR